MISEKISWSDEYLLGDSLVDKQHRKLFDIVDNILSIDDENLKESIKTCLSELNSYMNYHFDEEEKYMFSIKYPLLDDHKMLHKQIREDLYKLVREKVSLHVLKTKIKIGVKKVLIKHILEEDMKVQPFYFKYKETFSKKVKVNTQEEIVEI